MRRDIYLTYYKRFILLFKFYYQITSIIKFTKNFHPLPHVGKNLYIYIKIEI